VISVLRNEQRETVAVPRRCQQWIASESHRCSFFVRLATGQSIRPAQIINAFRKCGVEIAQIECRAKHCAVLTGLAAQDSINSAVELLCDDDNRNVFIAPVRLVEIAEDQAEVASDRLGVRIATANAEAA
jgi:hypothetical protein